MVLARNPLLAVLLFAMLSCKEDRFMAPVYRSTTAIATIKNIPIMSEEIQHFNLNKDSWLQIYGVGEASIDMVSVDSIYLYKPDEVALYLKHKNGADLSYVFPLQDSSGSSSNVEYTLNTQI